MNRFNTKAIEERRESPKLISPPFPAPQPAISPRPAGDFASIQAGVGNAAIVAAASNGLLAPSSDIFPLQLTYGNAAAAQAAEETEQTSAAQAAEETEQTSAPATPALSKTAEAEAKPTTQPSERMPATEKPVGAVQPKLGEEAQTPPAEAGAEVPVDAEAEPAPVSGAEPEGAAAKAPVAGPPGEAKGEAVIKGPKAQAEVPEMGAEAAAAPAQATAPVMDTSSSEGMLQSLAATPPSAASEALAKAAAAIPDVQAREKADLEASFPQVERPTGLPRLEERKPAAPTTLVEGKSPELSEEKGREGKPPEVKHAEARGPLPGAAILTEVSEPPTEEGANWWGGVSGRIEGFTAALPTKDPGVSTSAGPRPSVDLTGEANPAQNVQKQQAAGAEVNAQRKQADVAGAQSFGEGEIYPDVPVDTLRPSYKPTPPPAGPGGPPKPEMGLAGAELALFDQTTGPWYAGKVNEQHDKYRLEQQAYQTKSAETRGEGQRRIAEETEKTRADQQAMQTQARKDVDTERERWREENRKIQEDYATKSETKRKEADRQIQEKSTSAEKEADQKLIEAEQKTEAERLKAEAQAAEEKRKAKQKPRSWWQRVKGAISSVLNAIKKAVNAIFDGLRALVKGIFELAKKLVRGIIELARMAIVGLIKGFGLILKGLVTIALAAFPEAAKKARAWIDNRVDQAVTTVNKAAEALKKVTDAILDFVANTLDSLLGLVQSIQNAILTVVGMIITGEIVELMRRIGYLIAAAETVPSHFETAALEELLGGNLDEPLSPMELAQAEITPSHANPEATAQPATADVSQLPMSPWGEHNVGVDEVDHNMELSPELAGDLVEKTQGDGEMELASSHDQSRSMEAVMSEVSPVGAEGKVGTEDEAKYPDDGLNPRKRAEIKWQLMKDGIAKWWSDNWPTILAGAAAALLGFIALNIVTGGAITAALPAILGIIGPLFAGITVLKLVDNIKDYIEKGWSGEIHPAGKSLAKGVAAGAIELVSFLTFKAAGAALKGAKALAKGGLKFAKATISVGKAGAKMIARGVKFIIEKGKVLFRGIASGFAKVFKRIKELGEGLLSRLRFRKFRIRLSARRFTLEGFINPWVKIAEGEITVVKKGTADAKFVTEKELEAVRSGGRPKTGPLGEGEVGSYKDLTKKGVKADDLTPDHIPSKAALVKAEEAKRIAAREAELGRKLRPAEVKKLKLTSEEVRKINEEGITIATKTNTHKAGRTFGGKNKAEQIALDATDLEAAFSKDVKTVLGAIQAEGRLTPEVVGAYLQAYRQNVLKGVFAYSKDVDDMFMQFLKKAV